MELERESWQPKIIVEGERAGKVVSFLRDYDSELVTVVAGIALITGILSIWVLAWLQYIRLFFSVVTFVGALFTTGRAIKVEAKLTSSASIEAKTAKVHTEEANAAGSGNMSTESTVIDTDSDDKKGD